MSQSSLKEHSTLASSSQKRSLSPESIDSSNTYRSSLPRTKRQQSGTDVNRTALYDKTNESVSTDNVARTNGQSPHLAPRTSSLSSSVVESLKNDAWLTENAKKINSLDSRVDREKNLEAKNKDFQIDSADTTVKSSIVESLQAHFQLAMEEIDEKVKILLKKNAELEDAVRIQSNEIRELRLEKQKIISNLPATKEDVRDTLAKVAENRAAEKKLFENNKALHSKLAFLQKELYGKIVKTDVQAELKKVAELDEKAQLLQQQLDEHESIRREKEKAIGEAKHGFEIAHRASRDYQATENVDVSSTEEMNAGEPIIAMEKIPSDLEQADRELALLEKTSEMPADVNHEKSKSTEKLDVPSTISSTITISNVTIRSPHVTGKSAPVCYKCGKEFLSRSSCKLHALYDCGKPPIQCQRCGISLTPRSYKEHKIRNNCIAEKDLCCKFCSTYLAKDGKGLKLHMRTCEQRQKVNSSQLSQIEE